MPLRCSFSCLDSFFGAYKFWHAKHLAKISYDHATGKGSEDEAMVDSKCKFVNIVG